MSYCRIAPADPLHRAYHDEEYGFPVADDRILFERLSLEIFQAGLSWRLVLLKRQAFARAFADFDVARVAAFDDAAVRRLLADPAIIRNRRKIEAVIANARVLVALGADGGGDGGISNGSAETAGPDRDRGHHRGQSIFAAWLAARHPRGDAEWLALFRQTFRFMGPEVVREFLVSTGYLAGAHDDDCPVQARVLAARPPWSVVGNGRCGGHRPFIEAKTATTGGRP